MKSSINTKTIHIFVFLFFIQLVLFLQINTQTVSVNGKASTSITSVQYVKIKFEETNDPEMKYSPTKDPSGNYHLDIIVTNITRKNDLIPKFELYQNYPNPFSSSTRIPYELNAQSEVSITICDTLGRVVRKISTGAQSVGDHRVYWMGIIT